MPEQLSLERRLAGLERIENTVSVAIGVACAGLFVVAWYLWTGWLYVRSALVPFFIGSAISKFGFSIAEARLALRIRQLRGLDPLPLPEARVVDASEKPPAPSAPLPKLAEPARAPEPAPPPSDRPRFLG